MNKKELDNVRWKKYYDELINHYGKVYLSHFYDLSESQIQEILDRISDMIDYIRFTSEISNSPEIVIFTDMLDMYAKDY